MTRHASAICALAAIEPDSSVHCCGAALLRPALIIASPARAPGDERVPLLVAPTECRAVRTRA